MEQLAPVASQVALQSATFFIDPMNLTLGSVVFTLPQTVPQAFSLAAASHSAAAVSAEHDGRAASAAIAAAAITSAAEGCATIVLVIEGVG